ARVHRGTPRRGKPAALRPPPRPAPLPALNLTRARGNLDPRLFEIGTVFLAREGEPLPEERRTAGVMMAGSREVWLAPAEPLDFFDLKGVAERLFERLGGPAPAWTLAPGPPPVHPGASRRVGPLRAPPQVH